VRRLAAVLAVAVVLFAIAGGASGAEQGGGEVHLAMISPLTGPLSFVGVDNRAGVQAAVREINNRGGVRGRRIRVTFLNDNSNPTEGVRHMQQIATESRYVGVIGSGFSSVSLAAAPVVAAARIPYISMASSAAQVTPAKPYFFMTTATSRLFAYSMARRLRALGIRRIALMHDNGGFGNEGARNVRELERQFGFDVVRRIQFPLTSSNFTAELTDVRNSNAQALWLWNATDLAVNIVKAARQLGLRQTIVLTGGNASPRFLNSQAACPQVNGALINTYIGPVAQYVRRNHPSRAMALRLNRLLGKQGSTFNYDGYTAVQMFRRAIQLGGFSRSGITTALENRMKGFVGPGGRYYYSRVNHSGLQSGSMVVSRIRGCKMVPLAGQAILQKRR
jgi:branched-chain amino acid transport system substrate-binding protein